MRMADEPDVLRLRPLFLWLQYALQMSLGSGYINTQDLIVSHLFPLLTFLLFSKLIASQYINSN
jgi:hypothetical protein